MKKIAFVIPEVTSFVSGGNLYNQRLVNAIQEKVFVSQYTIKEIPNDLRKLGEQFIFVDSLYLDKFTPLLSSKKPGQVFYLIVHHLYSMYPLTEDNNIDGRIKEEVRQLEKYNGFLATSQFTFNYLREKQLWTPIVVLPPIPVLFSQSIIQKKKEIIKALVVANLLPRKGIVPLLKTLKHSSQEKPNFCIEIIGETILDETYSTECFSILRANSYLQKVVNFRGPLASEEVQEAYQTADILLSASGFETFGMALQEARYVGIPILAIQGGNVANHIQDGINGYVFDDISQLVTRFIQLVNSPTTFYQLQISANQYKKDLQVNTWEQHVEKFLIHLSLDGRRL